MKKNSFYIGNVPIGNGYVSVQSMTNTPTKDVEKTLAQIERLHAAGADLVRVSLPDEESAEAVKLLARKSPVPLIGDIHFSAKIALTAIENGIKKIRINPANMKPDDIAAVAAKCAEFDVPIRVGVNKGGFYNQKITPDFLAKKAIESAKIIEEAGWNKIVLAAKTSDPVETVKTYRLLAESGYPLHIGLTEAGVGEMAQIKSSVVIGSLLLDGIGDTIRVSLAGDPEPEVYAAKRILRSVGIDKDFVEIIACPTCARTCYPVAEMAERLSEATKNIKKRIKIAVMGCVVNGIGESKDADFGVCGGKEKSVIFEKGEIVKTVPNEDIFYELQKILEKY